MAKKKAQKQPSLLDLAKGLGKPKRKPKPLRKPKPKAPPKVKKAKVKSKPPEPPSERKAPKIPSNDRYRVMFRRLGPKDESIPTDVEVGDVVTFYGREGASHTRIVENIAGQMVRLAELTANIGGELYVVAKAESVNTGRLIEVLRLKEMS